MIDPTAMIEEITTLEQRLRNTNRRNATYALQISELQNRIKELETVIDEFLNCDDQPEVIYKLKHVRFFSKWDVPE